TVDIAANELGVAAKTRDVGTNAGEITGVRIDLAVTMIECDRLTDLGQQRVARQLADEEAGVGGDVKHSSSDQRITPNLSQIFVEAIAKPRIEADALFVVRFGAQVVGLHKEQITSHDQVTIEEVWIGHRGGDGATLLGQHAVDAGADASTDEVLFAQPDV